MKSKTALILVMLCLLPGLVRAEDAKPDPKPSKTPKFIKKSEKWVGKTAKKVGNWFDKAGKKVDKALND